MKTKRSTSKNGRTAQHSKVATKPTVPPAAPQTGADLVDMPEAIALLKTSRPTFYRWLRSGKLRGMKVGRQWRFYRADVARFLQGEGPCIEPPAEMKPLVDELRRRLAQAGGEANVAAAEPADLQVVTLLVALGTHMRASDLHMEPQVQADKATVKVQVRLRIDGVLHEVANFDASLLRPLIERWKTMANCNLQEHRRPQDGRIMMNVEGRRMDLRLCIVPGCLGEALTARFLDSSVIRLDLDRIDYAPADRARLLRFLASPWGLFISTGPTGSGKSTALYACLNRCIKPGVKVISVEDPVEYLLPGMTQIPVNPALGVTFPAAMRAVLRCDPDIIMCGEVREQESMQVLVQSVLTGHLVLTTLHAGEAAAALRRVVDIGIDPFLVADAVKLVMSQRLVRLLCKRCSRAAPPPDAVLARAVDLARQGGLDWNALPKAFRAPVGCAECHQTGFRGRTVIAETLAVSPAIGAALRRGAGTDELRAIAVCEGMTTFAADGIRRAAEGQTTLEEVLGVAGVG